jgi:hypothetical protein
MEALIIILLSWIVYAILSGVKGKFDGYLWHYWLENWFKKVTKYPNALIDMQKEGKYLHFIGAILITSPLILILLANLLTIKPLAVLFLGISLSSINPLFHLGYMFKTRNQLNKLSYPKGFKDTSIISDGNTDKNKKLTNKLFNTYKKRIIFAIISLTFLTLTIIFK